jgi:hypothetical protein
MVTFFDNSNQILKEMMMKIEVNKSKSLMLIHFLMIKLL